MNHPNNTKDVNKALAENCTSQCFIAYKYISFIAKIVTVLVFVVGFM